MRFAWIARGHKSGMPEHEKDRASESDESEKHPLTQAESPFKDDDEKSEDDEKWLPPVP
jgi:hypothetical protein